LSDEDIRRNLRDALDELDRFFQEFEKDLQETVRRGVNEGANSATPFVAGFSMRVGPEGKPNIVAFGDGAQQKGFRSPLSEQILDDKSGVLRIVMDMPGVEKGDIEISTTDRNLVVKADRPDRKYKSEILLNAEVDPDSAKADYKNGVLEISFSLRDKANKGYRRVEVD
jgi:HSP20 family protein